MDRAGNIGIQPGEWYRLRFRRQGIQVCFVQADLRA
jgi:hypothetical protein